MPTNQYKLDEKTLKGKLPDTTGEIVFVNSANGNTNGDGSSLRPFSTIEAAFNKSGLSAGDVIVVAEGHTETVAGAGGITADVAGVRVRGLGVGHKRPTITFSATASTIVCSAAGTVWENLIIVPSIDSVVTAFSVSAADVVIGTDEYPVEVRDASSTVEFVRAILTTTAGNNLSVNMKYVGFPAGNACVNAIRLVGTDTARIKIDFYGIASTAVVEFLTTACTNINVDGYFYVSGTTDLSKNVVDTATGSTWSVNGFDGAAGYAFSGGSGNAVAAGDLSAIASNVTTILANTGGTDSATSVLGADDADNQYASTNVVANRDGSVLERLEHILDCVLDDETTNPLGVNDADNAYVSSSVVANVDGSILERLEALMDPLSGYNPRMGFGVTKVSNLADGSGTDDLFTVTGRVLITSLTGEVTTVIGGAATLKIRDITNSVDLCAATTIDTDAVGTMYALTSITANILNGTGGTPVVGSIPNITGAQQTDVAIIGDAQAALTLSQVLDAADTGAITWRLTYIPLIPGSTVTAAA